MIVLNFQICGHFPKFILLLVSNLIPLPLGNKFCTILALWNLWSFLYTNICLCWCRSHVRIERMHILLWILWCSRYMSSLSTLFSGFLYSYWFFFILILSITEGTVLKSSTISVDLSISSFNSVSFASCILELCC